MKYFFGFVTKQVFPAGNPNVNSFAQQHLEGFLWNVMQCTNLSICTSRNLTVDRRNKERRVVMERDLCLLVKRQLFSLKLLLKFPEILLTEINMKSIKYQEKCHRFSFDVPPENEKSTQNTKRKSFDKVFTKIHASQLISDVIS